MTLDVIYAWKVGKRTNDINYRETKKAEVFNRKISMCDWDLAIFMQRSSHKLTLDEVEEIILCSEGRCAWCGKKLPHKGYQFDHIWPFRLGRQNTVDNIVLSCERCNKRKQDQSPIVWMQHIFAETHKLTPLINRLATSYNIQLNHTRSMDVELAEIQSTKVISTLRIARKPHKAA